MRKTNFLEGERDRKLIWAESKLDGVVGKLKETW